MRSSFDAALDDIERLETPDFDDHRPFAATVSTFAVMAAESTGLPGGGHSLWEFAAAWTPEADPPPPLSAPPPAHAPLRHDPPRPGATPEVIAEELRLASLRTAIDLAQARRRFMWDNHPDRRKDLDRDLANRRVAIANMLLDRALAGLNRRRRPC